MGIVTFPNAKRMAISDPRDVSAIEAGICAVAGLIGATGGSVAIAGRDLWSTPLAERIRLLGAMYAGGEVVFGWRDARNGETYNVALERLALPRADATWRAKIYCAADQGHAMIGAVADREVDALMRRLTQAASEGFARPLGSPGATLARLARG